MAHEDLILVKLNEIANKLDEQNLLQKSILNLNEASKYLDISPSHLYKLTSTKQIPHFCPQGKKLYFKREELDEWLQRNRKSSHEEIEQIADAYIMKNQKRF
jgi:excisionase family DNA binding protein